MGWRSCRSIDSAVGLGQEILTRNPSTTLYYVGDTSHATSGKYPNSGASDHNPDLPTSDGCPGDIVCAVDIMISKGPNLDALAEHIRQRVLAGDARPKYLIWNRRIFSGQGADCPAGMWRTYTGSNPHTDHIHLSIRHGPGRHDDGAPWGWAEQLPAPPEEDEDMPYLFTESSGAYWLCDAGKIVHIAGPNDLTAYRKAGVKDIGGMSDAMFRLLKEAYPPVA